MASVPLLLALLLCPPECERPPPLPTETPEGWTALKLFAATHEVAGPHEHWGAWEFEVGYVRRYYHALQGAPPLCDLHRLPPISVSTEAIEHCRAYQCAACGRGLAAGSEPERERCAEDLAAAEWIERVWLAAYYARAQSGWATQRCCLRELRELLGALAYQAGAWPPPIPVWRCRHID